MPPDDDDYRQISAGRASRRSTNFMLADARAPSAAAFRCHACRSFRAAEDILGRKRCHLRLAASREHDARDESAAGGVVR